MQLCVILDQIRDFLAANEANVAGEMLRCWLWLLLVTARAVVHCIAGKGRTGTCASAYLVREAGLSAAYVP